MRDAGASNETIAHALGTTWETVRDALRFADTGETAKPKPQSKRTMKRGPNKGRLIADEVVRLRDEEKLSFPKIAKRLRVSVGTSTRAYDSKQPQVVAEAAKSGQSPPRGRSTRLPNETFAAIERLSRKGKSVSEIVAALGCSRNTVVRELQRLGLA